MGRPQVKFNTFPNKLISGKFQKGDPPNPKMWKANFRCALNSLHDIERLNSDTKGQNAQRRYRFLDPSEARPKGEKCYF